MAELVDAPNSKFRHRRGTRRDSAGSYKLSAYGKWIREKGLDPAVLKALDRGESHDHDRDLSAVNDKKPELLGFQSARRGT
jgi:hypothetical protein